MTTPGLEMRHDLHGTRLVLPSGREVPIEAGWIMSYGGDVAVVAANTYSLTIEGREVVVKYRSGAGPEWRYRLDDVAITEVAADGDGRFIIRSLL